MWKELFITRQLGRANLRYTQSPRSQIQRATVTQRIRPFSSTVPSLRASKPQSEEDPYHDRTTLDPSRTETSQSATTDEVATQDTAFDPSNTAPETEIGASKEETKKNKGDDRSPLDVSAGDKEVSRARNPQEGGADRNEKTGQTIRGQPRKNRVRK
ncbi:hypothetical protein BJX99DRAFT_238817 [Aspergillus californicus]